MKLVVRPYVLLSAVLALLVIASAALSVRKPAETRMMTLGDAQLSVQLADTPEKTSRGLGGRDSLPRDSGMLFMFGTSDRWRFWMKDMRFPLDFIWIDENWRVVSVTPDIGPETYPQLFLPPAPVRYVLEVNAGWAAMHNIVPGTQAVLK